MTRTLSRAELTAALAARQFLLEPSRLGPAAAIRALTPLQGQDPPAPYVALGARVERFTRARLEAALARGTVVKTTLMRATLHLAPAADYPAYAQLARQARLRRWRKLYAHLDEVAVTAELREWLREPRSNDEIRERVRRYDGIPDGDWQPVMFARTLLPLVQLPPAGSWGERRRPRFAVWPGPMPDPEEAATLVARRYLSAFGPASRADLAAWAGLSQRDFAPALERLATVSFRDERGRELLDLPRRPLPPAGTRVPVRFLARWDQALLAHADRERVIPPELLPLRLGLSGAQTVIVDGQVAGTWLLERGPRRVQVGVVLYRAVSRAARAEIRAEAERPARLSVPDADRVEVVLAQA